MLTAHSKPSDKELLQERRSNFDVTNTVCVSSPRQVARAVRKLYESQYPKHSFDPVWVAFHDFERLYTGRDPEYFAVDTAYHDIQHTLDMTLALARLIVGYERSVESADQLGPERAKFALVAALFHDAGYIRHRVRDKYATNGAEFTRTHVSRSGAYLEKYLATVGLAKYVKVASRVVHFTGYEMKVDEIELDDPRDSVAGHLLGTADLLAQMADRCYLEKCRDRLYPEFVLGNVAVSMGASGSKSTYQSSRDLLQKTMAFYQTSAQLRLDKNFNRAYRYVEALYDYNPYQMFVGRNLKFLEQLKSRDDWEKLRRRPPCIMPDPNGEARLITLALKRLREISGEERETSRRLRALNVEAYERQQGIRVDH
jgi:hypothetical protein